LIDEHVGDLHIEGKTSTKFARFVDFKISGVTVYSRLIGFAEFFWNRGRRRSARQERRCWWGSIAVVDSGGERN